MTETTIPFDPSSGDGIGKQLEKMPVGSICVPKTTIVEHMMHVLDEMYSGGTTIHIHEPKTEDLLIYVPDKMKDGEPILTINDHRILKPGTTIKVIRGGVYIGELTTDKPDLQFQLDMLLQKSTVGDELIQLIRKSAHVPIEKYGMTPERSGQQKRRDRRAKERKNKRK